VSRPFQHPAMRRLLDEVAHAFTSTDAFLAVDRHLLFLCGGSEDTSLRKQFINYAQGALPSFRVFLAESAASDVTDYGPPTFLNLSQFEQFIAAFSDCIVIFLESVGAFAEIGLFSHVPEITQKLLVVNDIRYQSTHSFVNYGPLAEVNKASILQPVLYLNTAITPIDFTPIRDRLSTIFHATKYRRRFTFASYDALSPIARLAIVLVIVQLFSPISFDDIFSAIDHIFGNANHDELKHLLSLTVAVGYIRRIGSLADLFSIDSSVNSLLQFNNSAASDRIRISVVDLYREHFTDLYDLLSRSVP
jgi:hypothetical protein